MLEYLGGNTGEIHVALEASGGQKTGVVNVRAVFLQLRQVAVGPEHEHAAVPVVTTGRQQRGGFFGVRLLDKAGHRPGSAGRLSRLARSDIAVASLRPGWRNTKQHQPSGPGGFLPLGNSPLERLDIFNGMIRGQHQHDGFGIFSRHFDSGHRDRRGGVAAKRLQQYRQRLTAYGLQLLFDNKAVLIVGHHNRRLGVVDRQPAQSFLQHTLFPHQWEELLGIGLAREGPKP